MGPHPGVADDVLDVAAHLNSRHGKSLRRNEGLGNSGGDCDCHPSALGDFPMSLTHPVCIRGVIHADITAPHKRRGRRRGGASWCATSSCPSYPAPPFPPPSQSADPNPSSAFNNSYKWGGGESHITRSSRHRNSVCLLNGVTRRRCASNTIAFGTQRAATATTTKFPRSSWLVG